MVEVDVPLELVPVLRPGARAAPEQIISHLVRVKVRVRVSLLAADQELLVGLFWSVCRV